MAAHPDIVSPSLATPGERRRNAYYWRLAATGPAFVLFGLGAFIMGMVLLPLIKILPAPPRERRGRVRAVMRRALRLFVATLRGFGLLTYDFRGLERLGRPGQLIVANHPSLIDVVFLLGFVPGAGCVVKQGMWRNPLTRWAATLAEYIPNEPTAAMIEAASAALHAGQVLIIFPEGTRTRPGVPRVFHRGAANVALRAARIVTPVLIRCEPTTLTKAEPWYQIPPRRPHFSLVVGPDFELEPYRALPLPAGSRALNAVLHEYFEAELDCPAQT
jgi:1-acyl-sn-glycerol-3-phosphate acyltransferase